MISLKVKTAEFGLEIERIIKRTGKSAQQVIYEEGKLFAQDLLKMTPPFGNAPSTESFAAQRKIGEAAVERDVNRVFHVVDLSRIKRKEIRDRLQKLIDQRDIEGVKAVLIDCRIPVEDVVRQASPEIMERFRDSRGRVRKAKWIWVLAERSINKIVKAGKSQVGKAKSGWVAAAQALGVKVPGWITRHHGPGSIEDKTGDKGRPRIVLRNAVDYIQATGAELRIVEKALTNRIRNIRAKLERIAKSGWKK